MKFLYFVLTALMVAWLNASDTCDGLVPAFVDALNNEQKSVTVVSSVGCCSVTGENIALFDLLRTIYQPLGITIKTEVASRQKAKAMFESGAADILLGDSRYEVYSGAALYPNTPIFPAAMVAVVKQGRYPNWQALDTLRVIKPSWVRGAQYHKDLGINTSYMEVPDSLTGFEMVMSQQVDAYVGRLDTVLALFNAQHRVFTNLLEIKPLPSIKLFPVYSLSAKNQAAAAIYDCRIKQLQNGGTLQQFFLNHHIEFSPLFLH